LPLPARAAADGLLRRRAHPFHRSHDTPSLMYIRAKSERSVRRLACLQLTFGPV
jgi:hypothetical protein